MHYTDICIFTDILFWKTRLFGIQFPAKSGNFLARPDIHRACKACKVGLVCSPVQSLHSFCIPLKHFQNHYQIRYLKQKVVIGKYIEKLLPRSANCSLDGSLFKKLWHRFKKAALPISFYQSGAWGYHISKAGETVNIHLATAKIYQLVSINHVCFQLHSAKTYKKGRSIW